MNLGLGKFIFSAITIMLTSFFVSNNDIPTTDASLYKQADFPIGVAVNLDKLKNDPPYKEIVLSQFNSITAENVMKMAFIHPQENIFYFDKADYLVDFCQKNKKRLHGHTLVWHKRVPQWVENFQGDQAAWEAMLKNHIQTIVRHFKGNVNSWDVVNEAFNDDGTLRNNIWMQKMGESYIEKSFAYAREVDPSIKLFYNDYTLESNNRKLNATLLMVETLASKGVKIDGIGMQMHIRDNYPDMNKINLAAQRIQSKGLLVHYSEVDISLNKHGDKDTLTEEMLRVQKERIKAVVQGYRTLDKKYQFGITVWGLSDTDTWLIDQKFEDWPTLYDKNYIPKPAYFGFLEALTN